MIERRQNEKVFGKKVLKNNLKKFKGGFNYGQQ
jgi:hypothetical protein